MGSSVCEHHYHTHKFHPLISPKQALQDLNIPPRKLLSRRSSDLSDGYDGDSSSMQKLSSSRESDVFFDTDDDPYSSDDFRMYEFKVRKCTRSRSHDWTDCPFSHPGEKARRRDPRRYHYSGTVCPEYRRSGDCTRGDECEFAHGVFECYLHPARYRTEACKDGKSCKRKVCFFAHSPRELRVLPLEDVERKETDVVQHEQHCCKYCCTLSPTSTLLGLSNFSPPLSPSPSPKTSMGPRAGLTRYSDRAIACANKGPSYEDMVIADLLGSINLNESLSPNKGIINRRELWVDVNGSDNEIPNNYIQINPSIFSSNSRNLFPTTIKNNGVEESPDLRWVNDLLM
ncbi:unnamed protein product [Amaranthus hypochondriacus]